MAELMTLIMQKYRNNRRRSKITARLTKNTGGLLMNSKFNEYHMYSVIAFAEKD